MIKLSKISTKPPKEANKEIIQKKTMELIEKIGLLVETLMAEKKNSLLIVFQGMDASGKDGAFKNVFSKSPLAAFVYKAYGKPTSEEMAHDFLWRIHKNAPVKGQISISVRSHYEDILIQSVHNWIDSKRVAVRMEAINAYEKLLKEDNNTTVLKFFLHISPERQLEKLAERIEVPEKNWKHKDGDWEERKQWDKYMKAYENAINKSDIAWTIVPVDSRWYRDYIVAKKVYEVLSKMKLQYPVLPSDSPSQALLKDYKTSISKEENNKEKVAEKSLPNPKKAVKNKSGLSNKTESILKKEDKITKPLLSKKNAADKALEVPLSKSKLIKSNEAKPVKSRELTKRKGPNLK
jgi:PPK2 family polyphosphate:nucleotide phosphotransferase